MRRQLAASLLLAALGAGGAHGHTLSPGQQTVHTAGDRAIAYYSAGNGRKDVQVFQVELFEFDSWAPTRHAVASPERINVLATQPGRAAAAPRRFTVMVDVGDQPERTIRVCTKSIAPFEGVRAPATTLNTRICSRLTAKKLR